VIGIGLDLMIGASSAVGLLHLVSLRAKWSTKEARKNKSIESTSSRPSVIWIETRCGSRTEVGLGPSCGRELTLSPLASRLTRAIGSRIGGEGKMGESSSPNDPFGLRNSRCYFGISLTKKINNKY